MTHQDTNTLSTRISQAFEMMAFADDRALAELSDLEVGTALCDGLSASRIVDSFIAAGKWGTAALEATVDQLITLRTPLALVAAAELIRFDRDRPTHHTNEKEAA